MYTEEEYWFWLCSAAGIWQQNIEDLLEYFGSPQEIFEADEKLLSESCCLDELQIKKLLNVDSRNDFPDRLEKLKRNGIGFIWFTSEDYPDRLKNIPDPPYGLYVKGRLPDVNRYSIGMVGARKCTEYGADMARKFASALAGEGMQVISGMAKGIDSIAARAAMDAGGVTFAVLGSGIDVIYPRENTELYYEIIMRGGGIISEYAPHEPPVGWHFPHRNRLITGLSDKLLVMEAGKHSGTLTTAMHALDQGIDVYALPGRVTDPLSEVCNNLIADGAGILINTGYLIDDIYGSRTRTDSHRKDDERKKQMRRMSRGQSARRLSAEVSRKKDPDANTDQGKITDAIRMGRQTAEMIGVYTGIAEPELSQLLCEMELTGVIRQQGKDCYFIG